MLQKNIILLLLLLNLALVLNVPEVSAVGKQGKTKLLAVSEYPGGLQGAVAELELELIKGEGRVFLETYPLTKIDTQISMRFAKQVACNAFSLDCDEYDFIFTIRAPTGIIGGPSAGAAAAILIVSLFKNIELKADTAITGTINSGAIIGGVGGIDKKVQTAKESGIDKILIPKGKRFMKIDDADIDLVELGIKHGVEVKEVASLHEALSEFNGKEFKEDLGDIKIDLKYKLIMKGISENLCKRAELLKTQFETKETNGLAEKAVAINKNAGEMLQKSAELKKEGQYYSAASFCFRANIGYGFLNFEAGKLSGEEISSKILQINEGIIKLEKELKEKTVHTIIDLQTAMILKQRLLEAKDHLEEAKIKENLTERRYMLSLANERLFSAVSWSKFFMLSGKRFNIDKESLKVSCEDKIREAEERLQYTKLYVSLPLEGAAKKIERAYDEKFNEEYGQCLFKASKAKAEANMVINLLGADEDLIKTILEQKLEIAKNLIARSQVKGVFPILGYSYYEYAHSLKEDSPDSALLFSEYVLELSRFDIYFKEETLPKEILVVGGLLILAWMMVIVVFVVKGFKKKKRKRR